MIKSDEFNKIHCRSHNVNVYLHDDNECKKTNMNLLYNYIKY